jgi:hypothetical protein
MNYRDLLKKYMQVIIDSESISYVEQRSPHSKIEFTPEELAELLQIESECEN